MDCWRLKETPMETSWTNIADQTTGSGDQLFGAKYWGFVLVVSYCQFRIDDLELTILYWRSPSVLPAAVNRLTRFAAKPLVIGCEPPCSSIALIENFLASRNSLLRNSCSVCSETCFFTHLALALSISPISPIALFLAEIVGFFENSNLFLVVILMILIGELLPTFQTRTRFLSPSGTHTLFEHLRTAFINKKLYRLFTVFEEHAQRSNAI